MSLYCACLQAWVNRKNVWEFICAQMFLLHQKRTFLSMPKYNNDGLQYLDHYHNQAICNCYHPFRKKKKKEWLFCNREVSFSLGILITSYGPGLDGQYKTNSLVFLERERLQTDRETAREYKKRHRCSSGEELEERKHDQYMLCIFFNKKF